MTRDEIALAAAQRFGTPLYLYDLTEITARFERLRAAFGAGFAISYAVKANPNGDILAHLIGLGAKIDASSIGEVLHAIAAGADPADISFTGPAKTRAEIARAVELGIGTMVLESLRQAEWTSQEATRTGRRAGCVIRINPASVPRAFGARMTGKASQFGIDEDALEETLARIAALPGIALDGFHIYAGTNCLDAAGCVENFANYARLFRQFAPGLPEPARMLIFGTGFGIPYYEDGAPLDLAAVAGPSLALARELAGDPATAPARLVLELGRWLVGPPGRLLSAVISGKSAGGTELRMCDAGFNNHLAACGMMGSVIRRNYRMANLSNPEAPRRRYTLTGPLCTSIDMLAKNIDLPELREGDVIAVENSGAYGFTSSPHQFISHPVPREVLWDGTTLRESRAQPRPRHPGEPA